MKYDTQFSTCENKFGNVQRIKIINLYLFHQPSFCGYSSIDRKRQSHFNQLYINIIMYELV